jgi:hypothetical protein
MLEVFVVSVRPQVTPPPPPPKFRTLFHKTRYDRPTLYSLEFFDFTLLLFSLRRAVVAQSV